jgi:hypothetical protein
VWIEGRIVLRKGLEPRVSMMWAERTVAQGTGLGWVGRAVWEGIDGTQGQVSKE